ncbi:MAG: peptide chain release factor N(5)-glutamine methyltransferase [Mycobacteriaceae bacterium]|nr:peptide chain release factor N(5)-glutamine methyltransferase [Mycobacteriaceae bacterium]
MMRAPRLRQQIEHAAAALAEAGVTSPRADAEELAAHAAGTSRGMLTLLDTVDDEFRARYAELVAERSRRIPLQHIIGTAAFGPASLDVGPGVFIPRPETESLLEWAVRQRLSPGSLIVDLCTGSGALAVALARQSPQTRVIAIDNSAAAMEYARRNAAGSQVELWEGDVTDPALLPKLDGHVDLIVANPPYIPEGTELEPEVAEHDPRQALFGGPDGMSVITPIVRLAARWLRHGGRIAVEHDESGSRATVELFRQAGVFDEIAPHNDFVGRPRFVTARRTQ